MSVTVKLFLGEQDGLQFAAKSAPDVMWIMNYEARDMVKKAKELGIELDETGEPLPRLRYRLKSVLQKPDGTLDALYFFDEEPISPELGQEALPGEDTSQ